MSDPTPAPQVSPDGRFYWDGERWVPMPSSEPVAAPIVPSKPLFDNLPRAACGCLVLLAVIVVGVLIIGGIAGHR